MEILSIRPGLPIEFVIVYGRDRKDHVEDEAREDIPIQDGRVTVYLLKGREDSRSMQERVAEIVVLEVCMVKVARKRLRRDLICL